jgi:hypothetical protein
LNKEVWFTTPLSTAYPNYPPPIGWNETAKTMETEFLAKITVMSPRKPFVLLRLQLSNQDKPRLGGQTKCIEPTLLINHKE